MLTGFAKIGSMQERLARADPCDAPDLYFALVVLASPFSSTGRKDRLRWPFPFAFVWFAIAYATFFRARPRSGSTMWLGRLPPRHGGQGGGWRNSLRTEGVTRW